MAQQTAVEWLVEQLPLIQQEGLRDIIEQAKAMEKKQIMNANTDGYEEAQRYGETSAEDYYNETYNK